MKMKKRTNSVISSMYHPILGNSRFKTAACMFGGGALLVCLGVGLIVTTFSARRPPAHSPVDETSVLISGPTCLILGLVVAVLSGADMCRYRRARNSVESELVGRVMGGVKGGGKEAEQAEQQRPNMPNPKVSIIINKSLWPS